MGNSLQEQLLKAGLVDEHRLKEARTAKKRRVKQPGQRGTSPSDEARQAAQRAQAAKTARDRELSRQRQEEAARKAAENEIRQLIHSHRVVRDHSEVAFNFTDGNTLKRIYVSQEQHAKLVSGRLAVVRQDTFYEVIPVEIAERLRQRDPERILVLNDTPSETDPNDPYAAFQVPDDLIW